MSFRTANPATTDRQLREIVAGAMLGHINAADAVSVTLRASQTTTTLTDTRIGPDSVIALTPLTANAAGALGGLYVSDRVAGSATLTHASTVAVDKTFAYAVIG